MPYRLLVSDRITATMTASTAPARSMPPIKKGIDKLKGAGKGQGGVDRTKFTVKEFLDELILLASARTHVTSISYIRNLILSRSSSL